MVEEYTVGLALLDFVPNLFFLCGTYLFAKFFTKKGKKTDALLWYIGGSMVAMGGLFKASWKLSLAISGHSIAFLTETLFIWQSIGFTLLFIGSMHGLRREISRNNVNIQESDGTLKLAAWKIPLLAIQTLTCLGNNIVLIKYAFKKKLKLAGILLILSVILTFSMAGIASGDLSMGAQWIAEIINSLNQGLFAVAGWKFYRAVSN